MTAQFGERILLEGKERTMCTEPLAAYFELA
jgi:hypothetical protein